MPAIDYRIWAGPVRASSRLDDPTVMFDVGLHAKAKRNTVNDYEIANEIISLRLGQALGLPIPSGVPLEMNGERYFSSLVGASTGESLPPGNAAIAVADDPHTTCGAVLFDSWICNMDRHEKNFHFDEEDCQLYLIDHGNALFGANGVKRLESHFNQIGLHAGVHSIARETTCLSSFDEWEFKILQLPEFLLRDAVFSADDEGPTQRELQECFNFLDDRRRRLRDIFTVSQHDTNVFPKLNATLFQVLAKDDQQPEYFI